MESEAATSLRAAGALAALAGLFVSAPVARAQDSSPGTAVARDSAYAPGEYRVFTGAGVPATLDDVVAAMGEVEVVFVGETHDDPTGHMLEADLLRRAHEAFGAAGADTEGAPGSGAGPREPRPVVLSLEFFQRDAQPVLDEYLAGLITEKAFRADARPWPRYETDYRPLVEYAKEYGLAVIAANAPRRYTTRVTLHGREALEDLSPEAKAFLAPLPYGKASEAYRSQWIAVISKVMEEEGKKCGIPVEQLAAEGEQVEARAPAGAHGNMGNQLDSQVLWDATMAWSLAQRLERQPDALLLHMVGGFHVERGTGTPEQLESYRPGTSRLIVSMQAVDDVDVFEPAPEGEWGDFVIQTEKSRTLEEIECRRFLTERAAKAESR
jgi:uncharacterized iron-regulated protein